MPSSNGSPTPHQVGAPGELGDEVVVDRAFDDDPRAGRADLPGVQKGAGQCVVDGSGEVGVGKHDVRVLAAELEGDLLHRPRCCCHDRATGREAAGERHHVDARIRDEWYADVGTGPEDEVDDAVRQARLGEQSDQLDRGQRRDLARLDDRGVAGCEGGRELPRDLQQRVVPRRDQHRDADRLVPDPAVHARHGQIDVVVEVMSGQLGVVAEHRHDVIDVEQALTRGLARVGALQPAKLSAVSLEQVGDPPEQLAALGSGGAWPWAGVEGAPRGRDGQIYVVAAGPVDPADDARVDRVDHVVPPAGGRRRPLTGDHQVGHALRLSHLDGAG